MWSLKAEALAGLGPHSLTELTLQHWLNWFNSTCIHKAFRGGKQPHYGIPLSTEYRSLHILMLDSAFLGLIICPWSLSKTGSLVFLWFTYWNRTTTPKIKSNIFVCIKTLWLCISPTIYSVITPMDFAHCPWSSDSRKCFALNIFLSY